MHLLSCWLLVSLKQSTLEKRNNSMWKQQLTFVVRVSSKRSRLQTRLSQPFPESSGISGRETKALPHGSFGKLLPFPNKNKRKQCIQRESQWIFSLRIATLIILDICCDTHIHHRLHHTLHHNQLLYNLLTFHRHHSPIASHDSQMVSTILLLFPSKFLSYRNVGTQQYTLHWVM